MQLSSFRSRMTFNEAKKQNIYLPIKEVKNSSDKIGRVQGLYKYIKNRMLQFDRGHVLLKEQLCMFPHHPHDDGPDCLQMAFEVAQESGKIQVKIIERKNN